jgi:sialate O-acetylesterase
LVLSLGALDDFDDTFFNGRPVGRTDKNVKAYWDHNRVYAVPAALVKPGRNVVAVRLFDCYGGGGFNGQKWEMVLKPRPAETKVPGSYHADYREDFELGDDPYRYYRW